MIKALSTWLLGLLFCTWSPVFGRVPSDTVTRFFNQFFIAVPKKQAFYVGRVFPEGPLWQATVYDVNRVVRMTGTYHQKSLKKRHGLFTYFHPNGRRARQGIIQNDKMEGYWVNFTQDGRIFDSTSYVHGRRDGSYSRYYPGGSLHTSGAFSYDQANGTWYAFLEDGRMYAQVEYERGVVTNAKYFTHSGETISSVDNRFAASQGDRVLFDGSFQKEDDIAFAEFYGEPKRNANGSYEVVLYNLQGVKAAIANFADRALQVKSGIFYRFHSSGQLRLTATFQRNVLTGPYGRYYENGQLAETGNLFNGQRESDWQSWYPDGKRKDSGTYAGGYRDGLWAEWAPEPDGTRQIGLYIRGRKSGDWKVYDRRGRIQRVVRYNKWQLNDAETIDVR